MAADMEFCKNANRSKISSPENACVQEDAASADLPDLEHNSAQLCPLVGHLAHLLLRVRGSFVGHRQTGFPLLSSVMWIWTKAYGSQGTLKLLAILLRPSIIEGKVTLAPCK